MIDHDRTRLLLVLALLVSPFGATAASGQEDTGDFSLDSLSPEVPHPFHRSDLITMTGDRVHLSRQLLGLPDSARLDAVSYGKDIVIPIGPEFRVALEYSVFRRPVGTGGAVSFQAGQDGAAGDKFRLFVTRGGRTIGPLLHSNAPDHELTPEPPGPESDIDALSLPPGTEAPPIFLSVRDSVTVGGRQFGPGDILVVDTLGTPPGMYRSRADLGLLPGDDIDGLAIADGEPPGVYTTRDAIFISLTLGSPSHFWYFGPGAGDGILQISPPLVPRVVPGPGGTMLPGGPVITSGQLDLSSAPPQRDELDGLTALDPGPCGELIERPPPRKELERLVAACREWLEGAGQDRPRN